ncbi:MAG: YgaP-like transmembrane domain, partial [Pseudanabaena sp.]
MDINVGTVDRLIRLLLASAVFYLGFFLYGGTGLGLA